MYIDPSFSPSSKFFIHRANSEMEEIYRLVGADECQDDLRPPNWSVGFICTMNVEARGEECHSPEESADGQLALGMTGGRTLSNNKGRPPPMLGLRCGIDALDEACDGSTGSCANCFSNLANSSSSCAISRRYTRFCTSTRY